MKKFATALVALVATALVATVTLGPVAAAPLVSRSPLLADPQSEVDCAQQCLAVLDCLRTSCDHCFTKKWCE